MAVVGVIKTEVVFELARKIDAINIEGYYQSKEVNSSTGPPSKSQAAKSFEEKLKRKKEAQKRRSDQSFAGSDDSDSSNNSPPPKSQAAKNFEEKLKRKKEIQKRRSGQSFTRSDDSDSSNSPPMPKSQATKDFEEKLKRKKEVQKRRSGQSSVIEGKLKREKEDKKSKIVRHESDSESDDDDDISSTGPPPKVKQSKILRKNWKKRKRPRNVEVNNLLPEAMTPIFPTVHHRQKPRGQKFRRKIKTKVRGPETQKWSIFYQKR